MEIPESTKNRASDRCQRISMNVSKLEWCGLVRLLCYRLDRFLRAFPLRHLSRTLIDTSLSIAYSCGFQYVFKPLSFSSCCSWFMRLANVRSRCHWSAVNTAEPYKRVAAAKCDTHQHLSNNIFFYCSSSNLTSLSHQQIT